MRMGLSVLLLLITATSVVSAEEPQKQFPLIKNYGGIVEIPNAAEPPQAGAKILLDLTSDELSDGVNRGLNRAAAIANLYEHAGHGPKNGLKLAVVLHGKATAAVLKDDAYRQALQLADAATNPNLPLIRELKRAGIEIYVCGQAMARSGYAIHDAAEDVSVAASAFTVHVNKQSAGYVYVP